MSRAVKWYAESKYPMVKQILNKIMYRDEQSLTYMIDILSCDGFMKTSSNEENAYTS